MQQDITITKYHYTKYEAHKQWRTERGRVRTPVACQIFFFYTYLNLIYY